MIFKFKTIQDNYILRKILIIWLILMNDYLSNLNFILLPLKC